MDTETEKAAVQNELNASRLTPDPILQNPKLLQLKTFLTFSGRFFILIMSFNILEMLQLKPIA